MDRAPDLRLPSLVIAGRGGTHAAAAVMAGRQIGAGGAGQVGDMLLDPRLVGGGGQRRIDGVMQPGMPFRRNGRSLRLAGEDRKSTRLNSSHSQISYAVFCL